MLESNFITDSPLKELRVRPHYKAFFDKGRRLEKVIKYILDHNKKRYEHEPTYQLIQKKYPHIPTALEVEQLLSDLKTNKEHSSDNIYQYWHQGNSPQKSLSKSNVAWHPVHKLSALSLEKYEGDKHIILDYDSIHDYINIPKWVVEKTVKMNRIPMLVDFIRTMLLFVNGGIWCDLTMVLFNKIPSYVYDHDLFYIVRGKQPADYKEFLYFDRGTFRWEEDYKVRSMNGFIRATKENILLGTILFKFLEVVEGEKDKACDLEYYVYFVIFDYLVRNDERFAKLYEQLSQYPSDILTHYLVVYCSKAYKDELYAKVKNEIPLQRIKLSTRFFEGTLAYECLKKEGY